MPSSKSAKASRSSTFCSADSVARSWRAGGAAAAEEAEEEEEEEGEDEEEDDKVTGFARDDDDDDDDDIGSGGGDKVEDATAETVFAGVTRENCLPQRIPSRSGHGHAPRVVLKARLALLASLRRASARALSATMSKPPRLTSRIEAARVEVAHAASCELGEGALWHAELGVYLHVDIYGPSKLCAGPAVFLHNPYDAAAPPARCLPMPSFCGTVVPRASGGLLVALKDGVHAVDLGSGAVSFLLNPDGVATNRWNEGKCSPEGRFWAGTMGEPGKVEDNVGALYCVHADLTAARVVPNVTISNGLAWDVARKVMYFIDTPKQCVFAFDYDAASGAATNQRVAFRIPEGTGHPDGCCLDSEGNLWVAQWGGSRVCAYDPADGSIVAEASARLPSLPRRSWRACAPLRSRSGPLALTAPPRRRRRCRRPRRHCRRCCRRRPLSSAAVPRRSNFRART